MIQRRLANETSRVSGGLARQLAAASAYRAEEELDFNDLPRAITEIGYPRKVLWRPKRIEGELQQGYYVGVFDRAKIASGATRGWRICGSVRHMDRTIRPEVMMI
uniref:Uncharacterized protein n=1 Tax=Sphaerodactylus townsendi TaxID=933632 RepID=A0ACB8FRW2_9SAUR